MKKNLRVAGQNYSHVQVSVSYNKGGVNYFSGREERRGLYVHIQPCNVEEIQSHSGYVIERIDYVPREGVKLFAEELKRANAKRENALWDKVSSNATKIIESFLGGDMSNIWSYV